MVCFSIRFLVPIHKRIMNDIALETRIKHILRHANAELDGVSSEEFVRQYIVRVCDEDTILLLRDLPVPFQVLSIDYLQSGDNLYTYRAHRSPPFVPLLQKIYWLAKSTEKWTLIPNELLPAKQ